jgi:hypothetical protein
VGRLLRGRAAPLSYGRGVGGEGSRAKRASGRFPHPAGRSPSARTGVLPDTLWPATFSRREKGRSASSDRNSLQSFTTCPVRMLSSAAKTMRSELIASSRCSLRSTSPRIALRNRRCSRSQSS